MQQGSYREAIREYIWQQAKPPDKFSHQARLYVLARQVGAGTPHDDDVLYAAAWLHDLGVFIGHRPEDPAQLADWDHLRYVMERAPSILRQLGFPVDKINAVVEAIRTHMPSGKPTTIEGSLLRDADILEQLGAVGILRTVSKVGRDTRFTRFSDALRALRRNLDELPPQLQLDEAKRLARDRITILEQFLESAEAESADVAW